MTVTLSDHLAFSSAVQTYGLRTVLDALTLAERCPFALNTLVEGLITREECGQVYPFFTDLDGTPFVCRHKQADGPHDAHFDVDACGDTVLWLRL